VDVTGTAHPPPPLAFVRYINAVSDTFNLDFRAVDQVSYSQPFLNVAFRGLGGGNYQGYQAGKRHVRVFLDPNPSDPTVGVNPAIVSTFLVDTTFTFTAGTYYTIVHVGGSRAGSAVPDKFWIIADALPAQTAGNIGFRMVNAAAVLGPVDVHVGATAALALAAAPTASGLAFGAINPYVSQATGATVMVLTLPGTATVVGAAAGYTVQAGTAGTTAADPIYGSGVGGSIFTAFIFDASAAGTVGAAFATPGIVYWPDLQPPRTTTDMLVPATHAAKP
jgi:hypothetical protein